VTIFVCFLQNQLKFELFFIFNLDYPDEVVQKQGLEERQAIKSHVLLKIFTKNCLGKDIF